MALFLIVHHRRNSKQTFLNVWKDDQIIESIQTPTQIGKHCQRLKESGQRVFFHRCAWGDQPATICCSALVDHSSPINRNTHEVAFKDCIPLDSQPSENANQGLNFYEAEPVPSPDSAPSNDRH